MSAAKRRVKRKIARLVALDANHWYCQRKWPREWAISFNIAGNVYADMRALGHGSAFTGRPVMQQKAVDAMNTARKNRGQAALARVEPN